ALTRESGPRPRARFALLAAEPPSRASSMAARQAQGSPEKSRTDHGHRSSLLRRGRSAESERHIFPGYRVILSRVAIQIGSKSRTLTRNGVCYRSIAARRPGRLRSRFTEVHHDEVSSVIACGDRGHRRLLRLEAECDGGRFKARPEWSSRD